MKGDRLMQQINQIDPFSGRVDAIHNMGGLETVYQKHVAQFQLNYQDSYQRLCFLINSMEFETAFRLAHSIKGLASTLGMSELQIRAQSLESAIKEDRIHDLPSTLLSYKTALDKVLYSDKSHSSSSLGA